MEQTTTRHEHEEESLRATLGSTPEPKKIREPLDCRESPEAKEATKEVEINIKEELVNELDETEKKQWAPCDSCFRKYLKSPLVAFNFALFLCLNCGLYLCEKCFKQHGKILKNKSHICARKEGTEEERNGKIKGIVRELMYEKDRREKILRKEKVHVYEKVLVKHELDRRGCIITGLCITDNWRLVVCDYNNCCMKLFRLGSTALKRFIRTGTKPRDVTEVKIKQNSIVRDLASDSCSVTSKTYRPVPNYNYYLVVTFPWARKVLFINVFKKPAIVVRSISMENPCFNLECCDDKIYIFCKEDSSLSGGRWSVNIMSTDGVRLSVIQTDIKGFWPRFTVASGRVYLTDGVNDKIICVHVESRYIISQITLEKRSCPKGISVDLDGHVYICALRPSHNVYELDFDLKGPILPLLDRNTVYMKDPAATCFHCDKLFVSHVGESLQNFVSVIKLYTS